MIKTAIQRFPIVSVGLILFVGLPLAQAGLKPGSEKSAAKIIRPSENRFEVKRFEKADKFQQKRFKTKKLVEPRASIEPQKVELKKIVPAVQPQPTPKPLPDFSKIAKLDLLDYTKLPEDELVFELPAVDPQKIAREAKPVAE